MYVYIIYITYWFHFSAEPRLIEEQKKEISAMLGLRHPLYVTYRSYLRELLREGTQANDI